MSASFLASLLPQIAPELAKQFGAKTMQEQVPITGGPNTMNPRQNVQAMQTAEATPAPYERQGIGLPGLLGIKGKTRDVLGTIGDAFLVQAGHNPMYAPHKQQQDENEALHGFADDPMAAIKRLSAVNPQAAIELSQSYAKAEADKAQADLEGRNTESQIAERRANTFGRVQKNIGGLLHGANDATYPEMYQQAILMGERLGVDVSEFLPKTYDPNAIQAFLNMSVGDPDKLMDNERDEEWDAARLEDYDETREIQERNVDSQIGRRSVQNSNDIARTGAYVADKNNAMSNRSERTAISRTRANSSSRRSRREDGPRRSTSAATLPKGTPPGVYEKNGVRIRVNRDGTRTKLN